MTKQIYSKQKFSFDIDQLKRTNDLDQVHRIIIQPAFRKNGRHNCENAGPRFVSHFQDEIICTSTEPLLASARILKARGYQGTIEMWHHGSQYPSMALQIDQAAGLTVEEGERSPTFVKYKPFQTAPKSFQARVVALRPKKALVELAAVQGIDFKMAARFSEKSCPS